MYEQNMSRKIMSSKRDMKVGPVFEGAIIVSIFKAPGKEFTSDCLPDN